MCICVSTYKTGMGEENYADVKIGTQMYERKRQTKRYEVKYRNADVRIKIWERKYRNGDMRNSEKLTEIHR